MPVLTIEAVTVAGEITAVRINDQEFACQDDSGSIIVPKKFLNNFTLSQIPDGILIKPVESVEGHVINVTDNIALTSFRNGAASGLVEVMLRRKYWDGDVGLSKYVAALRKAIAAAENVVEADFDDDGDYVFLHYEVTIPADYDVQDAIALVEAAIRSVEERTEQLLKRRTDGLLGIYDRGSFNADLAHALRISGGTTSLVMIDIDHFKPVNDTHGHQVGDDVLRAVAQSLSARCTGAAAAYRYGGEELVAILNDTDHDAAMDFAESIRSDVENLRFERPSLKITVSIGVATAPVDGKTPKELIGSADAALYAAKHGGRNCVKSSRSQTDDAAETQLIRVHVMLNKMNSGRKQITVRRPAVSAGAVMTYRQDDQLRDALTSLTISGDAIDASLATLAEIGPMELLKIATIDISHEVLHSLGFKCV